MFYDYFKILLTRSHYFGILIKIYDYYWLF